MGAVKNAGKKVSIYLLGLIGLLVTAAGFLIPLGQGFIWLRDGQWHSLPLFTLIKQFPVNDIFLTWLRHPDGWYRLQKITIWFLEIVPVSLCCIAIGYILLTAYYSWKRRWL
jgi:hypothetical protein